MNVQHLQIPPTNRFKPTTTVIISIYITIWLIWRENWYRKNSLGQDKQIAESNQIREKGAIPVYHHSGYHPQSFSSYLIAQNNNVIEWIVKEMGVLPDWDEGGAPVQKQWFCLAKFLIQPPNQNFNSFRITNKNSSVS